MFGIIPSWAGVNGGKPCGMGQMEEKEYYEGNYLAVSWAGATLPEFRAGLDTDTRILVKHHFAEDAYRRKTVRLPYPLLRAPYTLRFIFRKGGLGASQSVGNQPPRLPRHGLLPPHSWDQSPESGPMIVMWGRSAKGDALEVFQSHCKPSLASLPTACWTLPTSS